MPSESSDLRVDRSLVTGSTLSINTSTGSLKSLEDQGANHAADITDSIGIRESLAGSFLLQAIKIGNVSSPFCRCGRSEQAKSRVNDIFGVVYGQKFADESDVDVP